MSTLANSDIPAERPDVRENTPSLKDLQDDC